MRKIERNVLMQWMRSVALPAVALALMVSGCGSSDNGQSATAAGGGGGSAAAPKAITIAIGAHQDSLDPTQFIARQLYALGGSFGGTLTVANRDATKVAPGLAQSWTSGKDSWTFKLRPNLKFSDGTPLTARDVAATLNYLKDRKDNINGYPLATFKHARARNDREVEIATDGPTPRFDFVLSMPFMMIYPADKLADPEAAKKFLAAGPISAGQYMIESTSSNKTVLVANPNYWGPKPAIEQETWITMLDPAARLEQVEGGQVDFADDLPGQTAPQLTGEVHPSYTQAAYAAQLLVMNTRKGFPTSSLPLREAISAGIDRSQLSSIVYSGRIPAQTGLFPASSEYSEPFTSATADVDAAKASLAKSDCPDPCSLKLTIPSSVPDYVQLSQLISQQLDAVGIEVTVESLDDSVFFDREGTGNFDLLLAPPFGFYAEDFVNYALPSEGGGAGTWSGWSGADAFVEKWQTADPAGFKVAVDGALKQLAADKPFVPLVGVGYMAGSLLSDSVFSMSPVFGAPHVAPAS
jgi:ABC-type transport system substrate-binding protein